jgi:plastocyanin
MIIPRPLLEDIANGKCLPFIGAGFSKNAVLPQGLQMPDWDELTKEFLKDLNTFSTDRLEIANEYEKKFDRRKILQIVEKTLLTNIAQPGEVHKEFAKINDFHTVYTTNFDNLLEDAYKQVNIATKSLAGPLQVAMLANPPTANIIKMHGDFYRQEHLVITKNDYDGYIEKYKAIVTQISYFLMTMTPLFIGYSLSDPNFMLIRKMIGDVLEKYVPKAYIVLLNPTSDEIQKFESMNLHVIPLSSDKKTKSELLIDFFKEISLYKSVSQLTDGIEVTTKRYIVVYGGPLTIRTRVKPNPNNSIIKLKILNPTGNVVYQSNVPVQGFEQFTKITVKGSQWIQDTQYDIIVEYDGKISKDKIHVSKSLPIVVQTDKSVYIYGTDLIATIINPNVINNVPINLEIFDLQGKVLYKNAIPVNDNNNGIYQEIILVGGKDWDRTPGSMFRMIAEYAGHIAELTFFISNFGATVILDQRVYTWTDRVYITIVAPDKNYDPNVTDTIGEDSEKIVISTTNHKLEYRLEETGPDTGIFTGYAILTGDPRIKDSNGVDGKGKNPSGITGGIGPIDGQISCQHSDLITVSYDYGVGAPIVGTSIIRWNIGEIKWLESKYAINSKGVLQIIDPDMNLDPKIRDKFDVKVWSDSDPIGIKISMIETGEATGIFQGVVNFVTNVSEANNLKVKDGDKAYGEYVDRTLPPPYTPSDQLRLQSSTIIGHVEFPPLLRVSLSDPIVVDKNNQKPDSIRIHQLVLLGAKITNKQDNTQSFTIVVQIQDENGITVHNSTTPGALLGKQSTRPLLMWRPETAGIFEVQIFAFDNTDNQSALSYPLKFEISVISEQESIPKEFNITKSIQNDLQKNLNHNVIICSGSAKPDNPNFFIPEVFTVKKGDKVTWFNEDMLAHTITNGKPSDNDAGSIFDSGLIRPNQTFSLIFDKVGTYYYCCIVHPWKVGIINVE